jgi:Fe-S cluster assembly protein SufD
LLALDRTTHERLTADLSAPLRDAAVAAFAAFEALPMPSPTEEDWRYVEVPEQLPALFIPDGPGADPRPSAYESALGASEFAGADVPSYQSSAAVDKFAAAAGAFGGSGVVVEAAAGEVVARPVFVSTEAATAGAVSIPRVLVIGGEAAVLEVVVEQRSSDGLDALVLPEFEVIAGKAARVSVTVVQTWGDETVAIGRHRLRADQDGFVGLAEAAFGARFSRLHLTVDLAGRGADARITGAYFGDGEQTLDYRYFMNHLGPKTTSEMFLKGVHGHDPDRA